ncbi:hypothetical protein GGR54DRAFT_248800 [Hypoxylon sp. NC1633]|nr:hypothetical protein GGR54DRAFT_248800 [Hypoxylon sp. NC1633]
MYIFLLLLLFHDLLEPSSHFFSLPTSSTSSRKGLSRPIPRNYGLPRSTCFITMYNLDCRLSRRQSISVNNKPRKRSMGALNCFFLSSSLSRSLSLPTSPSSFLFLSSHLLLHVSSCMYISFQSDFGRGYGGSQVNTW